MSEVAFPYMERNMNLGVELRSWRARHKWTQQVLANELGIARHRLIDWENAGVPRSTAKLVTRAMRDLNDEYGYRPK